MIIKSLVRAVMGRVFPPVEVFPSFDLHKVEAALRVNHLLYNGVALTESELQSGVAQYRQFLADHKAAGMPEKFEVPSYLVDRVWHTHMCETDQYQDDCFAFFGRMFHHRSEVCNGGVDQPVAMAASLA